VVTEIRIYAEGGGDSKHAKGFLREGFGEFLRELRLMARQRRVRWHIVTCGSRNAAFSDFRTAQRHHPQAFNVLLLIRRRLTPWAHLQQRDGWACEGVPDAHCHLMTQAMEAWFIADPEQLATFYGEGFRENSIPGNPDVEQIPWDQLTACLKEATRHTQKGEYHKIHHAGRLLELIDPAKVQGASRHCKRLFTTLQSKMEGESANG